MGFGFAEIIANALQVLRRICSPQSFDIRRHATTRSAEIRIDDLPVFVSQDDARRGLDRIDDRRPGRIRFEPLTMRRTAKVVTILRVTFEVSERAWVYQHHPDWLIHNAQGKPIPAGWVSRKQDQLYMLDCTNPGAQKYLYQTYSTLAHVWGIRYIKLDFMDDSAIEGYYYRPHTTALEAQRIGLGIIRKAVGDHVMLDKDGSAMLNPVGYVDFGRISQDTGHTFSASREAAPGIAARYYMNRNYFVADPDAFSVSEQTITDQSWHNSRHPLTLDEAKVSIALAAVTGGMYEIGDDLPILGSEPARLALVENQDLIDMARLGRSSNPVDLMSYLPEDEQPSMPCFGKMAP